MNRLSITGTWLLTAFCLLTPACNRAENEQVYTENTKAANEELKNQISQLKQSIQKVNSSNPSELESIIAAKKAELDQIDKESTPIRDECKALVKELESCQIQHETLKSAIEKLDAQAIKHGLKENDKDKEEPVF